MRTRNAVCVDTDPHICEVVTDVLNDLGYRVDVVSDGTAALRIAQQHRIAIAFVSLELPGTDAFILFRQMRELHSGTQGIFMTTLPHGPALIAAGRSGVTQIMIKPVDDADFLLMMDDVNDHSL